jgi:hypothetical protein
MAKHRSSLAAQIIATTHKPSLEHSSAGSFLHFSHDDQPRMFAIFADHAFVRRIICRNLQRSPILAMFAIRWQFLDRLIEGGCAHSEVPRNMCNYSDCPARASLYVPFGRLSTHGSSSNTNLIGEYAVIPTIFAVDLHCGTGGWKRTQAEYRPKE